VARTIDSTDGEIVFRLGTSFTAHSRVILITRLARLDQRVDQRSGGPFVGSRSAVACLRLPHREGMTMARIGRSARRRVWERRWSRVVRHAATVIAIALVGRKIWNEMTGLEPLLEKSPFADDLRRMALFGDLAIRVGVDVIPMLVVLAVLTVALLPNTWHDLKTILGRRIGRAPERRDGYAKDLQIARDRLGFTGLFIGATVALGSWVQSTVTQRTQLVKDLVRGGSEAVVRAGVQELRELAEVADGHDCSLCEAVVRSMESVLRVDEKPA
jgi:hypothetical protein